MLHQEIEQRTCVTAPPSSARREQGAAHEFHEVVVREERDQHARVARLAEGRADAQAHGLDAEAVEVVARQGLAEAFRHAVDAVRPQRHVGVDDLVLPGLYGDLASRFPDRYPRLLLVAAPTAPTAASLKAAAAIALIAGARDRREHLREAAEAMEKAGRPVTFMLLPGAAHGEYGPEASRVMGEALAWALAKAP